MPTLRLRFPGRRYHATPWGHHVNEGQIEWPPGPWRLLRALIACGFNTQRWSDIPPLARQLLEKLAETLPLYRLPPASAAHSRHFMPIGSFKKPSDKKQVSDFEFSATTTQRADLRNYFTEDTTLVFDTWADIADEILEVHWDCKLTGEEQHLLGQLAACLGYLGRSESWVEAELLAEGTVSRNGFDAIPHRSGTCPGPQWEQVTLMAAIPSMDFAEWRRAAVDKALADFPLPEGNRRPTQKLLRQRAKAEAPYPTDLIDCLTKDTAWWKQHRWSQPPGSQRVVYWRRSGALEVSVPQRPARRHVRKVSTMLLAMTTPSGSQSALPSVTRTLPQAELFHRAIVGRVARGERVHCLELTGKDRNGRPLREGHRHAHVLPVDLDADRRLDHILIYAPMGLGDAAQQAIRTLRRTWTKGGVGALQLALVGSGNLDMLRSLPAPLDRRVEQLIGPREGTRVWVSATPFVPPRFLKRRGANTLLGQINAELASRHLPPVESVSELPRNGETLALRHFVRVRQRRGTRPPADVGHALRLEFGEPIRGPLALGYASHFGLGLFVAE
jgi:CRISPR-associated protein Csb2